MAGSFLEALHRKPSLSQDALGPFCTLLSCGFHSHIYLFIYLFFLKEASFILEPLL